MKTYWKVHTTEEDVNILKNEYGIVHKCKEKAVSAMHALNNMKLYDEYGVKPSFNISEVSQEQVYMNGYKIVD